MKSDSEDYNSLIESIRGVIQPLEEKPVGMFRQLGRKLGAKALSVVGAGDTAARVSGAAKTGDVANKLWRDFNSFIGETGIGSWGNVTNKDVSDFFISIGIKNPSMFIDDSDTSIDKSEVEDIFMKFANASARQAAKNKGQKK